MRQRSITLSKALKSLVFAACVSYSPAALAAEWVSVATNAVGDKFFVDKSSIQRNGDNVWYWEYREFPQPNNAFLQETIDQPLYGAVVNWSGNCASKTQRLRQITAYDKEKKVIRKFNYGNTGNLAQSRPGSSTSKVLDYVCNQEPKTAPDSTKKDTPSGGQQ